VRWVRAWWPLGVVTLLVTAALVTATARPTATLTTTVGSPEAAVQQYLTAVLAHDAPAAARMLAADGACDASDLAQVTVAEDAFALLLTSRTAGDRAVVTLAVTSGSASLVPVTVAERPALVLERGADERWLLSGTPWPMWACGKDAR